MWIPAVIAFVVAVGLLVKRKSLSKVLPKWAYIATQVLAYVIIVWIFISFFFVFNSN